jgi:hypothetical protein
MVVPDGERSIATTRACFEPRSPFFFRSFDDVVLVDCGGWAAIVRAATGSVERLLAGFDIWILHSVSGSKSAATTEAPSRPLSRRGRIPERVHRPELTTVPLCLRWNASPFGIILLLVLGMPEHPMTRRPHLNLIWLHAWQLQSPQASCPINPQASFSSRAFNYSRTGGAPH